MVYHLPLRKTEGFLDCVFELMNIVLAVPDHSTVSRRVRKLGKTVLATSDRKGPVHLLLDSSGLRIHVGSARKPPKRRAWRKIHLGVDRETGEILAVDLTGSSARDSARVPSLLKQIDRPLASASGDGAYDTEGVYEALAAHSPDRRTTVTIPPQKGALLAPESDVLQDRNRHIRAINKVGRREWHKRSGFTRRSGIENTVYRHKTIMGRDMKARTVAGQRVEARIGGKILNTMAKLGMPESYRAA